MPPRQHSLLLRHVRAPQVTWVDNSGAQKKQRTYRPDEDKVRELLVESGWYAGELNVQAHYAVRGDGLVA